MTGLDKILERIEAGAKLQADDIIGAARAEAAEIIRAADEATDAETAALVEKTREQAELIGRIADSGVELESRNRLLAVRQEIISAVIGEALERLRRLPTDKYFAVCERLAVRFADEGEGEIVFSRADRDRLPDGFIASLNKKLASKGTTISLSADTVESDGGFVLRYGGVEENCSFAAIAEQNRESLADKLGGILFA